MIQKLRTIVLGTVAIAAVLFATGPVVATHQAQAQSRPPFPVAAPPAAAALIVNKAIPLFGVNLPFGRQSPTFIQNVTQLAKMGFDSPQNAKLFLQLDSIALNASSSHPGNVTLTTPTINHIISVYNQTANFSNNLGNISESIPVPVSLTVTTTNLCRLLSCWFRGMH
ncbi:MAG: hypothetical protein WBZ36_13820 [Candidatus Nitrosopolaris sp.]